MGSFIPQPLDPPGKWIPVSPKQKARQAPELVWTLDEENNLFLLPQLNHDSAVTHSVA